MCVLGESLAAIERTTRKTAANDQNSRDYAIAEASFPALKTIPEPDRNE